ncbi:MAG: hypothetical protein ACXWUD_13865 [Methylosarcina sp.]
MILTDQHSFTTSFRPLPRQSFGGYFRKNVSRRSFSESDSENGYKNTEAQFMGIAFIQHLINITIFLDSYPD